MDGLILMPVCRVFPYRARRRDQEGAFGNPMTQSLQRQGDRWSGVELGYTLDESGADGNAQRFLTNSQSDVMC